MSKEFVAQVCVFIEQEDLPIHESSVVSLVLYFLQYWKVATQQVSVYFLTDPALAQLHDEVFADPSLTDTITLPMDAPGASSPFHILGEVFVSPRAAFRFLEENNQPLSDSLVYEEVSRYVVHSLFHLLGYDDQTEEEARDMRERENDMLDLLRKEGLLLHP